jgi:hypothetical protein
VVRCAGSRSVVCRAGDGAQINFPSSAVAAYDDEQAAGYAASHETGQPTEDVAPVDNDAYSGDYSDEYSDDSGSDYGDDYSDDSDSDYGDDYSDEYGDEIPNYDQGTGYRVQCADGMYSHSGGRPGACSHHGGVG